MDSTAKNTGWNNTRLGSLGEFKNGVNFGKEKMGQGIRLINVKDIFSSGRAIDFDSLDKIDLASQKNIGNFFVREGDLFFVRSSVKREGVGLVSMAQRSDSETVHCGFVIRFRLTNPDVDPMFLTYMLRAPYYREVIRGLSGGVAITNISQDSLGSLSIDLPPLSTQRRIASILSAYDDLIENNTRRIKLLEQMAQAIYREWFVEFRAPGVKLRKATPEEQKVTKKDRFPVGWKLQKTTDGVWVNPPTKVPKDGEKPFIPMSSLPTDSMLINDIEYRTGNSGSKFKNSDTLFARITPCLENGKTAYVQFLPSDDAVAFGSTEFIVLRSKTLCPEFVYIMARSDEFRDNAIKSMTGATGRQRVQEACFDKFFFAHPGAEIISAFAEIISPMFRNVHVLAQKNANLRRTRDLLLPRLVGGEIDVEEITIDVEESSA